MMRPTLRITYDTPEIAQAGAVCPCNPRCTSTVATPGDDLGWSVPSDEPFQFWFDRVGTTDLALYGRRLWEAMSSHWPTADQQPGATPAQIEFARRWRV